MQFILQRLLVAAPMSATVAALIAGPVHAQVTLISNLNSSSNGTSTSLNAPSGGQFGPQSTPYNSKAAGFVLPANTSYTLNTVNLNLQFLDLASSPFVAIYGDNGLNNPGTLLTTLADPTLTVGTGTFSFTAPVPFTLAASTEYWVVVSNQSASQDSFYWLSSEPNLPTGIATSTGYRLGNYAPPPQGSSGVYNMYSVIADAPAAVPEASTTISFGLLLALGMGGLVIAAKKKVRA